MRASDLHWLAGLLEGEGCFTISHNGPRRRPQLRIAVGMTDLDVVQRAAALCGVERTQSIGSRAEQRAGRT